jgi:hypothetical protein
MVQTAKKITTPDWMRKGKAYDGKLLRLYQFDFER